MTDTTSEEQQEYILEKDAPKKTPEISPERPELSREQREELSQEEIQVLRDHIESVALDDGVAIQATTHAQDIQSDTHDGKIEKLLSLAKTKGIVYAVHVAKKIGDPYLIDALHDELIAQGYYHDLKYAQST